MSINFNFSGIEKETNYLPKNLREIIKYIVKSEKRKLGTINIILTDNIGILEINKKYLKHNYFTDVITFEANRRNTLNGDIFISVDQVRNNSLNLSVLFEQEFLRVLIHGILHLIGYDDKSKEDKIVIRNMEDKYLCMFKNMKR